MKSEMKLSDAISLGATLKPQQYGAYGDGDGTCALGAALDAVGQLSKYDGVSEKRIRKIWPWLTVRVDGIHRPICSQCGSGFTDCCELIIHWNDKHKNKRLDIVERIRKLEPSPEMDIYYQQVIAEAEKRSLRGEIEACRLIPALNFVREIRHALTVGAQKLISEKKPKLAKVKKESLCLSKKAHPKPLLAATSGK